MIITAWFKDRQVLLEVNENDLVYDGNNFVSAKTAKFVTLSIATEVNIPYPVDTYPIMVTNPDEATFATKNYWVCKVISRDYESNIEPSEVIQITDPTNGQCICGVTCQGTEVVEVKVYAT